MIFGNKGQLGKEFEKKLVSAHLNFYGFDKDDIDITDYEKLNSYVNKIKPAVIINCSAYNNVDLAEKEPDLVNQVNVLGVGNLAKIAKLNNSFLVHFSSNYVFDGQKSAYYTEEDSTNPINKYGLSKLQGENALKGILDNFLIFRLSWLYGDGEQNFIYKFLNKVKNKEKLVGTYDEVATPTWTKTVVDGTLLALDRGLKGLYNLVETGRCSRLEWAQEILRDLNSNAAVESVSIDSFNSPAKRPKNASLCNTKICSALGVRLPSWQESLREFLQDSFFR